MVVEFQVREAIDSLVALLRVAEDSAVHCWEQDKAFHPGIFPGLILLARFASQRAGEEFRQAIAATEQIRKLNESCDQLQQQLAQVIAERDAARQQHLIECRKYNAEVERRLALEKQLAEMNGRKELQNVYGAGQAGRIVGLEGVVESLKAERDELRAQLAKVRAQATDVRAQVAELSGNPGELPAEPAAKTYQWQVGDRIVRSGSLRSVLETRERSVRPEGWEEDEFVSQEFLEGYGWKLHRKASDKPDSTDTDGEGQP
jgi:flagellar biosynthesis chaperone FliJ